MLMWMLIGIAVAVFFGIVIMRDALADDKRRKLTKRPSTPNSWQ
jgi:hypothetical protein